MKTIRIGSGAGYAGDIIWPALDIMEQGDLDYIAFECLAERTIALAQTQKLADPGLGYNDRLTERMEKILPLAHKDHVKVITNMGAANVAGAVAETVRIARELGLAGLKIAGVEGDDITGQIGRYEDRPLLESGAPLGSLKDIVSANVYLGAAGIVEALKRGADIVITGRCADPALFLAPLIYEFGWQSDDLLGKGTAVGHLLECGGYLTGGYFAGLGRSHVDDVWDFGYPIAEVREDGSFCVTKLPGSGGRLDRATCIEQLLYEIHDPANYITPDVVADFSHIQFEEVGPSRVKVTGATGRPATPTYKVSIGYRDGVIGTTEISNGGYGAIERCEIMIEGAKKMWMKRIGRMPEEHRIGIIGYNAQETGPEIPLPPKELLTEGRIRCAVRGRTREEVQPYLDCVTSGLGAHACGASVMVHKVVPVLAIASILVPKADVEPTVICQEV